MTRYAVYYTAHDAPDLREAVRGWYALAEADALTASPRRYGFHATLKAPMRLADGVSERTLLDAVAGLGERLAPAEVPSPTIDRVGGFFAIVPGASAPGIRRVVDAVVADLDRLRAPLTRRDVARRRPELLTEAQRGLLERWGYPYVFSEYRFHMTLTERVPDDAAGLVSTVLHRHLDAAVQARRDPGLRLDAITVCVEDEPGAPFRELATVPLAGNEANGDQRESEEAGV